MLTITAASEYAGKCTYDFLTLIWYGNNIINTLAIMLWSLDLLSLFHKAQDHKNICNGLICHMELWHVMNVSVNIL